MTEALQRGIDHVQFARATRGSIQRAGEAARIDWGRYNLPVLRRDTAPDCVSLGFIVSPSKMISIAARRSDVILFPKARATSPAAGDRVDPFQVSAPARATRVELTGKPGIVPITDAERKSLRHVVADVGQIIGPDRNAAEPVTRVEVEWAQEELLAAFAEALAGAGVPDPKRPSGAERLRIVRAVESYLESHLGDTLRIDDLCSTVGTNLHTLERAFAEVQGISPKRVPDVSPPRPRAQRPKPRAAGIDFGDRRGEALGLLSPPFRCRIQGPLPRVALATLQGRFARLSAAHPVHE
jgi:hypothetical protein